MPQLRSLTPEEWERFINKSVQHCKWAAAQLWWIWWVLLVCVLPASGSEENDRAYLVETASPGFTMLLQGVEVSIGRLHPDFAERLAATIREAREQGMEDAGIFSAYRPPAFGIGGFKDKFDSLHAYGLAVDMTGIGEPRSETAKRFHAIARKHGIACIYGPDNSVEWNHCQATTLHRVGQIALRNTITADGPIDLERMWNVGERLIVSLTDAQIYAPDNSGTRRVGKHRVAKHKHKHETKLASKHKNKHKFAGRKKHSRHV